MTNKIPDSEFFDRDPEDWTDETEAEASSRLARIVERFRAARRPPPEKRKKLPADIMDAGL